MTGVTVVIGAGAIGLAIARRVSADRQLLLADLREQSARQAAETLADPGFTVSTAQIDIAKRASIAELVAMAREIGSVKRLIHAAGVLPSKAPVDAVLKVDLCGTAVILEPFGEVIARGGSGVVIASQSGHRLPALTAEEDRALALTPAYELLALPFLASEQVCDTLHAYQLSKRGNGLRVGSRGGSLGRARRAPQLPQPRHCHDAARP